MQFFWILSFLFLSSHLQAGGINLYEIGSQEVGLASAGWSARADNPSTAFTNPAGMSRLKCSELELGAQPVYLNAHFDPNQETSVKGKKGNSDLWIPAGGLYYVEPINDCFSAGISVLGYFGAKLNFNHSWVGRYYITRTVLQGFSVVPAVSYRIAKGLSVGVGTNVMFGIFSQRSAVNNVLDHLPDGSLKLRNNCFGFGSVFGILYEWTPCTRLGLQYLSKVSLQFRSLPHFHGLGPTLQKALQVTGVLNSKVLLDVIVPQSVMFSIYHDLFPCLAIMGNAGWQEWSNFQKATVTLGIPSGLSLTATPKYQDTWHVAFGAKYWYKPNLALMAGFAYDSSAVKSVNRPLDFPVGKQHRYGLGAEWQLFRRLLIGLQYELQSQGDLKVDVNKGFLAGHVSGAYKNLYIHFFNFNLDYVF